MKLNMKWAYSIKNKFLTSVVLLVLCLLVLLSNYLDRVHTENVTNSIVTLYEDRLIAEDYILKMTSNIYQIKEVINSNNNHKSDTIHKLINEFNNLHSVYIKTKLTRNEKIIATDLINHFKSIETKALPENIAISNNTDKALQALNKLSDVQLEESQLIIKSINAEYNTLKLSSQFAFAIIIIILAVLQAIVFSTKSLTPINQPKDPSLN